MKYIQEIRFFDNTFLVVSMFDDNNMDVTTMLSFHTLAYQRPSVHMIDSS